MSIGRVCVHEVLVAPKSTTVHEAARIMRQHHVGDLVMVDSTGGRVVPTGIVTDRDIVLSVVATGLNPDIFTIGDLVTSELVTVREDEGILETIQQMRFRGIRRAPVVNAEGDLVGIITVDDLIKLLGEELSELAKLISREQVREARSRV